MDNITLSECHPEILDLELKAAVDGDDLSLLRTSKWLQFVENLDPGSPEHIAQDKVYVLIMDETWSLRKAGMREGVRGVRKEEKECKNKVVLYQAHSA